MSGTSPRSRTAPSGSASAWPSVGSGNGSRAGTRKRRTVIERHVEFSVNDEAGKAFEVFFAQEYRPAMACQEGFRGAHLLRDQDDRARYQMVIRFDTLEQAAYWRSLLEGVKTYDHLI